jgi:hypothetical protein
MLERRFQCVSATPLGSPVLPLVKMMAAISSGRAFPATRAGRGETGREHGAQFRGLAEPEHVLGEDHLRHRGQLQFFEKPP